MPSRLARKSQGSITITLAPWPSLKHLSLTPTSVPLVSTAPPRLEKVGRGSESGLIPNGIRKLLPRALSTSHSTERLVELSSIPRIGASEVYIGYSGMR